MKIVEFSFCDIIQSPEDCSAVLNKACQNRQQQYKVIGCVSNESTLFVTLELGNTDRKYRFAQFPSFVPEEITAEIVWRYNAGFSTIGSFIIDKRLWGLFATQL